MEKFEKREKIDRRRKKKEQESAEAISGLKMMKTYVRDVLVLRLLGKVLGLALSLKRGSTITNIS